MAIQDLTVQLVGSNRRPFWNGNRALRGILRLRFGRKRLSKNAPAAIQRKILKKCGLEKDTLVIFTCDNGPWLNYGTHCGTAGPLREGKGTCWEGGIRVPMIARWPAKIPAKSTCSEITCTIDILPTVAKAIGAKLPERPIDGKDITPLLVGKRKAKTPHDALFFYYKTNELHAMRSGKWKLILPHSYRTLNGRRDQQRLARTSTGRL